jgi:hypothetical protein
MLLPGCLPERASYVGGACDATRPCPSPLACSPQGVCVENGQPMNNSGGGGGGGSTGGGGVTPGTGGGQSEPDSGVPSTRQNLLRSGDFEGSPPAIVLTAWNGPTQLSQDTTVRRNGLASGQVSESNGQLSTGGAAFPLTGPLEGMLCAEVWMLGSGMVQMKLVAKSFGGGFIESAPEFVANAALNSTSWQPLRTRLFLPSTAIAPSLVISFGAASTGFWMDDASVWISQSGTCSE